jgi:hypothetical protein
VGDALSDVTKISIQAQERKNREQERKEREDIETRSISDDGG